MIIIYVYTTEIIYVKIKHLKIDFDIASSWKTKIELQFKLELRNS